MVKQFLKSVFTSKPLLVVLVLMTAIGIAYGNIIHIFFQQDEWYGFGQTIFAKKYGYLKLLGVLGTFHLTPFSNLLFAQAFSIFNYNSTYYAFSSLFLHLLASYLVYVLAKKVLNSFKFAVLASIFFSISNAPQQAITWFASFLNTIPAAICGLVSLIFFIEHFKSKNKSYYFAVSIFFLIIGLGFKEDIFSLFIFYFLILLLKYRFYNKKTLLVFLSGLSYTAIRFFLQYLNFRNMHSAPSSMNSFFSKSVNFVMLPFKGFSQLFFTQSFLQESAYKLSITHGEVIYTSFSILFTFLLLSLVFFVSIKNKRFFPTKKIAIYVIFIFCSLLPFGLLPAYATIASRHLYFPSVGSSIFMSYFLLCINKKYQNNFSKIICVGFIAVYLFVNIRYTHKHITYQTGLSNSRKAFVLQLKEKIKHIPSKTLIYYSGDPLNLQVSLGYIVAVLYHEQNRYEFLLDGDKLWSNSEGYFQHEGVGIGFYSDYKKFINTYRAERLNPENIVSFNWNEQKHIFTDTSSEIRNKLNEK